jgi:hypothetical protein
MASVLTGTRGDFLLSPETASEYAGYAKDAAGTAGRFAWDTVKSPNFRTPNNRIDQETAGSGQDWYDWSTWVIDQANTAASISPKLTEYAKNKVIYNPKGMVGKALTSGASKAVAPFAQGVLNGSLFPSLTGKTGIGVNLATGLGVQIAGNVAEGLSDEYVRDDAGHMQDWRFAGRVGDYDLQQKIANHYATARKENRQLKSIANGITTGATIGPKGAVAGGIGGVAMLGLHQAFPEDGEFGMADPSVLERSENSNRQGRIDEIKSTLSIPRHLVDPRKEAEASELLVGDFLKLARKDGASLEQLNPIIKMLKQQASEESDSPQYSFSADGASVNPSSRFQTAQKIDQLIQLLNSGELQGHYDRVNEKYAPKNNPAGSGYNYYDMYKHLKLPSPTK